MIKVSITKFEFKNSERERVDLSDLNELIKAVD
jgi:hypothetical protein